MALNLNYKPNKLVDITTLTEDQWLDWRRKGIGGSDVAVALNSSPYRTARELYYDKIGVVMADEGRIRASLSNWASARGCGGSDLRQEDRPVCL